MNWKEITFSFKLSEEFIEKYQDEVHWLYISQYQKLSEDFIEKFQYEVDWYYISQCQKLSEEFIEKHQDKVVWVYISQYQRLSEDFIEKNQDKVYWNCISAYQKLSEEFIEKFKHKVDWLCISAYQKLNEDFIEKHQDKVDWDDISIFQKLSEEFRKKYNIEIPKDNWLYTSKEDKLKYIKEKTNYEIIDDQYILAYKSTRADGYSVCNFQYKYEIGKTYESHCDCNIDNENSFGLSAWTKEDALWYYNRGELYLVKIMIEDIGTIIHDNHKIRCFKLEVLEKLDDINFDYVYNHNLVSFLAYDLWLNANQPNGRDLDFWLEAENDARNCHAKIL